MSPTAAARRLPAALARWSDQLAALDHGSAISLGPMLHRLDELVGRHSTVLSPDGEPDGFDGIARRGTPDRLLISEWLLAEELPDEFVRRAVAGELLHLAPARQHDGGTGRTVLLLDCGPDLHGAPRLLQLALALVLHRRAAASGREFRIGLLGAAPGTWLPGDLPAMLRHWLRARTAEPADRERLAAWLAELDRPAEAWVVCTEAVEAATSTGPGPRPRSVTVREDGWTAAGPSALLVSLAGERLHLPLPEPNAAVRVLRGEGWRRTTQPAPVPAGAGLRHPVLVGAKPVLLARGAAPGELVRQRIPEPGGTVPRFRRHRFRGEILAASSIGTRLVVLVARDDVVVAEVLGKHLADVHRIEAPLDALGLTESDLVEAVQRPPGELAFTHGGLLARLTTGWWLLHPGRPPRHRPDVRAVLPTSLGSDRTALLTAQNGGPDRIMTGCDAWVWRAADGRWRADGLPDRPDRPTEQPWWTGRGRLLPLPADAHVIGAGTLEGEPGAVVLAPAGQLLRLVTPDRERTLTRWSGGIGTPSLHPVEPLVAVQRDGGAIEVGDLRHGTRRLRLEPD